MSPLEVFTYVTGVFDIVLLSVIVWQGELIRRYEKWTYEMQRERHENQMKWRIAKQLITLKKNGIEISDIEKIMTSASLSTMLSERSKAGAAEPVESIKANSTPA